MTQSYKNILNIARNETIGIYNISDINGIGDLRWHRTKDVEKGEKKQEWQQSTDHLEMTCSNFIRLATAKPIQISRKIFATAGGNEMFEDEYDPLGRTDWNKVFAFLWIISILVIIALFAVVK